MSPIDEIEFIYQLSLRNFRKHKKGFNFSCPICNEGKHPSKKRGFILIDAEKSVFYCHNGCPSMSLKSFIEKINPIVYEDYCKKEKQLYLEGLKNGTVARKKQTFKPEVVPKVNIETLRNNKYGLKYIFKLSPRYFIPAEENPECVAYAQERRIPEHVFKKMKYCTHPNIACSDMLIFPFYYDDEHVYGFQGRALKEKKFHNFCPNEAFKVYNIFHVDLSKPVYIFESIIDSLHKKNSVAMLGTSLSDQVKGLIQEKVWCLDNDAAQRGKPDKKGIDKALELANQGEKVFVWPRDIHVKDLNELATKYKWTDSKIDGIILDNIRKGLVAISMLKFKLGGKR